MERIGDLTLLDDVAKDVPEDVMTGHYDSSYGIFSGPAEHTAKLKFTSEMSRWIAEEQWHPDQKGSGVEHGAWTLELPFSSARELVMDFLRYGPEVKVESPEFLREAVAESARQAAALYD